MEAKILKNVSQLFKMFLTEISDKDIYTDGKIDVDKCLSYLGTSVKPKAKAKPKEDKPKVPKIADLKAECERLEIKPVPKKKEELLKVLEDEKKRKEAVVEVFEEEPENKEAVVEVFEEEPENEEPEKEN